MGRRRKEAKPQKKAETGIRVVDDLSAKWLPEEQERGASEIVDYTLTFGAESIALRIRRSRIERIGRVARRCVLTFAGALAGWAGRGLIGPPELSHATASTQCEVSQETGSTRRG